MKRIRLTINLDKVYGTATAITIAKQAAEHLKDTFNGDDSLGKIVWEVLPDAQKRPKIEPDLKSRVIAELSAWCEECEDIADAVTSTEEVLSYTERVSRIKALIKEVEKS